MASSIAALLFVLPLVAVEAARPRTTVPLDHDVYTNSWVVEIAHGGKEIADTIAAENCFKHMGQLQVSEHFTNIVPV